RDALASQLLAARGVLLLEVRNRGEPARREVEALGQPVGERDDGKDEKKEREVAGPPVEVPAESEDSQAGIEHAGQQTHQSSTWRMARNASCGTSTEPICFMRFL